MAIAGMLAIAAHSLVAPTRAPAVRTISYKESTYSVAVVPAARQGSPPIVLLPPIGVGIDRTFCGRFLEAWAATDSADSAMHAIDPIGVGDSGPKPKMRRRLQGGWAQPPRTPLEWAEQVVAYVLEEVGEPCIVIGQSNLCTVALEAARIGGEAVRGVVLIGPPAVEALSLDKSPDAIQKVWRIVGSPVGAALFRFARRKPFLESFSKKNLFAEPSQVDATYLETCAAGAADADSRHAVFSFVAGTWRRDYTPLLSSLALPTLIVSGRDVGAGAADGAGVGKPEAEEVDKTSFGGLVAWFKTRGKGDRESGRFAQVGRDLGLDPERKLRDFVEAMPAAQAAGAVETSLLPGWNVLVYESPAELATCVAEFVQRRFSSV